MQFQSNIFKEGLKVADNKVLVGAVDLNDLPSKAKYIHLMLEEATEEAHKMAQAIIENAHHQADQMRQDTENSLEEIRTQARKEAYEEGFTAGTLDATAKADEIFSEILRTMGQSLQELERLRKETLEGEEERVVKLISLIAYKIIQRDLTYDPKSFYEMLRQAIANLDHKPEVSLYLHPQSAAKLKELKPQLLADNPGLETLNIIASKKLGPGELILESAQERRDLRLSSQINEALATLLKHNPQEEAS